MPGVVLVNPHSGPDETAPSEIAAEFPGSLVHEIEGHTVKRQVEEAIEEAADPEFLAVAGGDGTIRCAAGVVVGTALPLLAIPAGTRNHFARELGIPTLADAARAASGRIRSIDVGEVNGEVFVNNANIGIYPRIVADRTAHQKRFSKQTATLVATWQQLTTLEKFWVTVDGGERHRAWMVFIGNGRYGSSLTDLADREELDGGILDVRIMRADGKLARLRVALSVLLGRAESSAMTVYHQVSSIELGFTKASIEVALDGEILSLPTPLRFRCRAKELKVLVPKPESASEDGGR